MKQPLQNSGPLAQNKRASYDLEVLEKLTAGMVLTGAETKSAKAGHANLKGSYVEISASGEAWVKNIHISPYKHADQPDYNPTRRRKLLLHKKEIAKLQKELDTKGITVVPLNLHIESRRVKVTIGICRGKKKHDRRDDLKQKSQTMEIRRTLKSRS